MLVFVFVLLRIDRQLQYRSGLPCHKLGNLQNLPIRKFQCVVLDVRIIRIDFTEARDLVINTSLARKLYPKKTPGLLILNILIKCEFRSR